MSVSAKVLLSVCLLGGLLLPALTRTTEPAPADTILLNGKVYTVNAGHPRAQALAIREGRIVAVGSNAEIERYRGPKTHVIDAAGRLVLPGITDAHFHLMESAEAIEQLHLDDATTLAETLEAIKKYGAAHPGTGWILGRGWIYSVFGAEALPHKKYLDQIFPDRPVFLQCYDGHTYWANSKALALAGITRDTPDPPNGKFVRDPQTGELTGAIKEDEAGDVVKRVIPKLSRAERLHAVRLALAEARRVGLVRVHCAQNDYPFLEMYDQLRRAGELTVRLEVAHEAAPPAITPGFLESIEQARRRYHDEWISAGSVKFFLDGVIEAHTAAMLTPYSDNPNLIGATFWEPPQYTAAVAELDRRGFQIFTHAIGDKAVRLALDAYENAQKSNGTKDARNRIEHIETISAVDIPRFGRLGVIASMQPLHAYPENNTLQVWARNVGPERMTRAFAWQSIAKAGGRLAFGSDWNVVTMNPWEGMQNAITRQTVDGQPPGGWIPEQRVSLTQAIEAYTLGAAIAGRREKNEGTLEPGKLADLIVVIPDLFETDHMRIGKTEVLLTMVGGKIVYQSPNWKATGAGSAKEMGR
jgi:predicted amidohydrolase YtcJ